VSGNRQGEAFTGARITGDTALCQDRLNKEHTNILVKPTRLDEVDWASRTRMARLARAEVFAPDEIAIVHMVDRVVRRCFLLGNDSVTGNNDDHRKNWIEEQLRRMATGFGIDLLFFPFCRITFI
jgi:hypothetical protein